MIMPDIPICDDLLTGFLLEDKGPCASCPEYSRKIPTLGALFPRGGPVQDPVLTGSSILECLTTRKLTPDFDLEKRFFFYNLATKITRQMLSMYM